jgi:hypothetical protein
MTNLSWNNMFWKPSLVSYSKTDDCAAKSLTQQDGSPITGQWSLTIIEVVVHCTKPIHCIATLCSNAVTNVEFDKNRVPRRVSSPLACFSLIQSENTKLNHQMTGRHTFSADDISDIEFWLQNPVNGQKIRDCKLYVLIAYGK